MNPWPISPVATTDLDFAVVNYDFTSFTGNEQAELPSLEAAIDLTLLDFTTSVIDQTSLIASLFDGLDDLPNIPGEIASSDDFGNQLSDLSNAASAGDAALNDYLGFLTPPSGGSSGGSPTPPPTQSAKCGTHGASSITLSDDTGNCFAADVTPILDIADGTCYKVVVMDGSDFAGRANVTGATLLSGDAQLFSVSVDRFTPQGSSTPVSRVTFKLTPYKTGHFLAKFTINTSDRNPSEIWCLIADVINSGSAGGGGSTPRGVGGTPLPPRPGTPRTA